MDEVDFAIFRYMSPDGIARLWGSRRLIDPRITPKEIARRVGVSESGVRRRIQHAAEDGYYRGTQVWPNSSIFGASLEVVELAVASSKESQRVLNDLALVEGVTFARDILDENNRKLRVYFVTDGPATTARRLALLRRLAPQGSVRPPQPYWIPPCAVALSSLDFRLLRALRAAPDDPLTQVAASVGLSLKTTTRHYQRLLDSYACWWTHSQDSEEFPLALLTLRLEAGAERNGVAGLIERVTPDWMPLGDDGTGSENAGHQPFVAGLVPFVSPARLERTIDKLAELPRVSHVERTFALGSRSYPEWFDRHIEAACARR